MGRSTLVAAALVVLLGCGGGDNGAGPGGGDGGGGTLVHATRVTATTALSFNPQTVSIPAKDTIYFTFENTLHNVKFDAQPGAPTAVPSTQNADVKRVFNTAGTFNYHCSIHPTMTGVITVTP
jgi:plastocyanin